MRAIPRAAAALLFAGLFPLLLGFSSRAPKPALPYRLVYLRQVLNGNPDFRETNRIIERASRLGFNGVVLAGDFDYAVGATDEYAQKLRRIKEICDEHGMMIIPALFSVGWGGATLSHDRNLAAATPLRSVPFLVKDGGCVLVEDPDVGIANGGFERADRDRFAGYTFQDEPGRVSFRDEGERWAGDASLRLENFRASPHGLGRIMQETAVRPFRCYRVKLRVKSEGLAPEGTFQVLAMTKDGRSLVTKTDDIAPASDWHEVSAGFNSLDYDTVRIYAGIWGGSRGKVWIDELSLTEVGLINVTRRPGTPLEVRNAASGILYREGEDYERIEDHLSFELDHEPIVPVPKPGGRIREGDRLTVSGYQALSVVNGQVAVCMSEPRVYEIWRNVARRVQDALSPDHYFLSMDEIRQGGWCGACEERRLSAAEMLGDCVTRQVEILRGVNPDAEIFIWSDMLDPNHNAVDRYYLFNGDFSGSWERVPEDLIVACWYYDRRTESLGHFDALGFRTLGCGYYDSDDADAVEAWMESLARTPGSQGIMYTTWKNRYYFLDAFAQVVRARLEKHR